MALALLIFALGTPALRAAATEDFLVQVWDVDSGLPHSTVSSIAQTPDGYLWVGTLFGGLARFDGVRFVNFNPGNTPELRSIEIQKLLVDSQGTLWVGTVNGALTSYRDGRFRFERQNFEMPQAWLGGVVSSETNSVVISSFAGWLLRGLHTGGTNRWTTLQLPDAGFKSSACADPQGVIWYRTEDNHLGQVRSNQCVRVPNPPGLRGRQINALITDAAGRLWVGTDKELARWDGTRFVDMTPTNGEPDLTVNQICACPDGTLWVWSNLGFRKYQDQQWVARVESWDGEGPRLSSFPMSPLGMTWSLFGDSRGGLWVLHYGDGLWHADANGQVSRVRESQGLPNALVECWLEDHEGNVWLGLDGGGLACVRVRTFHTVWPTGGKTHLVDLSICEDPMGAMWFGTSGNTLLRWRDGEFTNFIPLTENTVGREITVCPDDAGRLWVGSVQNGVVTLENEKFSRPFPADDIGTVARVIYKDRAGRIWIGSEFGLFCWEQEKLKRFMVADGFPPAFVTAITEDKSGNLWIGTALGELRRYQNGKFISYWPKDSPTDPQTVAVAARSEEGVKPFLNQNLGAQIGGERFSALYADDEGVIWIGSLGGGLLRFQAGQFTRFNLREGLPNEYVSQILEDGRGQLWLGTRSGITRVSKAALNQFARRETNFVQFTTYGKIDGLPTVECSAGSQPACWRSRDGHLWFATVKGAIWTDPEKLSFNTLPPPVVIEEISVDDQRLARDGQPTESHAVRLPVRLKIPPGRHYLDFKFTALSFTSPDKVRFKWRLAGLEKDWVSESSRRSVSYSFVLPGDYEFQVQACNNDGVWNETGAAIKLTVLPYFWQTWWFKVAAGATGLAGILGAVLTVQRRRYRARMQVLERQNALELERTRIARDIHDQVGANLTKIGMQTDLLGREPGMTASAQPLIQGVADTTREMLQSMDEIVWAINPRNDTLKRAISYLIHYTRDFLRPAGISYHLDMPVDLPALPISTEIRHNLFMAFKEALNNAVKHGHPRCIRLVLVLQPHQLKLVVEDDGCGFTPATSQTGADGLDNMRQRLKSVGGHCQVESAPSQGTKVTFQLPLQFPIGPDTPIRVY